MAKTRVGTMTIKLKHIDIYSNDKLIGYLTKQSNFVLSYKKDIESEPDFINNQVNPLSFAANFTENRIYQSVSLNKFPFLTSSFPEGFLLEKLSQGLREKKDFDFHIDQMLMLALFGDNQIGRLSFKTDNPAFNDFLLSRQEKQTNEIALSDLLSNNSKECFEHLLNQYLSHFSLTEKTLDEHTLLSGYQPKLSLKNKTSVHNKKYIVKTFSSKAFDHLSLNEYICLSIAKEAGLPVPNFYLSDDQQLFIIERFDFIDSQHSLKYGVEDFCSLLNLTADEKYSSNYPSLLKVMAAINQSDVERLFSYIALSALVKNGDAHLKNFSILYHSAKDVTLAPVYDIVNTAVYPTSIDKFGKIHFDNFALPLKQSKSRDFPTSQELIKFGSQFSINTKPIVERINCAIENVLKDKRDLFTSDFYDKFSQSLGFRFESNNTLSLK